MDFTSMTDFSPVLNNIENVFTNIADHLLLGASHVDKAIV